MPLSDRGETGIGFAVARNAVVGDFAVDAVYMPGYAPDFPVYGQQFGMRRVVPAADFRFAGQVFSGSSSGICPVSTFTAPPMALPP